MFNGTKEERYIFWHIKFDEITFLFLFINVIMFCIFKVEGIITLSIVLSLYMFLQFFVLNNKFNTNKEVSLKEIEDYDNLYTYKIIEIISVILIFLIYLFFIIKENKEIIFKSEIILFFTTYLIINIILFKASNILFNKYDKINGETKVIPMF